MLVFSPAGRAALQELFADGGATALKASDKGLLGLNIPPSLLEDINRLRSVVLDGFLDCGIDAMGFRDASIIAPFSMQKSRKGDGFPETTLQLTITPDDPTAQETGLGLYVRFTDKVLYTGLLCCTTFVEGREMVESHTRPGATTYDLISERDKTAILDIHDRIPMPLSLAEPWNITDALARHFPSFYFIYGFLLRKKAWEKSAPERNDASCP